jgi:hypothetical protein
LLRKRIRIRLRSKRSTFCGLRSAGDNLGRQAGDGDERDPDHDPEPDRQAGDLFFEKNPQGRSYAPAALAWLRCRLGLNKRRGRDGWQLLGAAARVDLRNLRR